MRSLPRERGALYASFVARQLLRQLLRQLFFELDFLKFKVCALRARECKTRNCPRGASTGEFAAAKVGSLTSFDDDDNKGKHARGRKLSLRRARSAQMAPQIACRHFEHFGRAARYSTNAPGRAAGQFGGARRPAGPLGPSAGAPESCNHD